MIVNWVRRPLAGLQSLRCLATAIEESIASNAPIAPITADITDNRFAVAEQREMGDESRRTGVLAFKRGMMSHYDKWGYRHPVTVLDVLGSFKVGPSLIQEVGLGTKSPRQTHHAQLNYFAELKLPLKQHKRGFSVTSDARLPPGTFLRSGHFVPGQLVDVQAKSIGKGFQGGMKRWGFAGMPASHGTSRSHRSIGCTGARSDPGRTFRGKKMAGRMGGHYVTVRRLRVLKVDHGLNCIMVRGAVPGHDNQAIRVTDSKSTTRRELARLAHNRPLPFPTFLPKPGDAVPREEVEEFFEKDPLFVGAPEK